MEMRRYNSKIDVLKINKEKIIERTFVNKEGQNVTVKELELEIVPVKEIKEILNPGQGRRLMKVGFISEKSIKNEDGTYTNGTILGDVTEWQDVPTVGNTGIEYPDPADPHVHIDNIPF